MPTLDYYLCVALFQENNTCYEHLIDHDVGYTVTEADEVFPLV